ncbi:asparagine synthase-related protein [Novosphingobium sp. SL115]|uniref:asparagine synthase-related protein n=1 Tax=Novosphingobium sp. SL115 TaxID=2995150 RepID=UPI002272DAC8|nr:asparagine synthetase B family protein [Novosphingobium sp. SL115]MCY1669433.1 asparagine synthase-related protein [Novosphingobium sp. SL115]
MTPIRFTMRTSRRAERQGITLVDAITPMGHAETLPASQLLVADRDHLINLGAVGFVIGYLFDRSSSKRLRKAPQTLIAQADARDTADWLIRECWGAYVALLNSRGTMEILPDPSGLLPCYVSSDEKHIVCTSDLDMMARCDRRQPQVSWESLAVHLQRPDLRSAATCLSGIQELVPGHIHSLEGLDRADRTLWAPAHFMPPDGPFDFKDLSARLQEVSKAVIRAWSQLSSRTLVAASGGVDSSLVAAALADTGQDFGCLTVATPDPSGDERAHVRVLAQHLGVPLFEGIYAPERIDLGIAVSAKGPRPVGKAFMQETRRMASEAREALGADVVFDGNGGDNLFCYLHGAAPVLDRLSCEGLGRGTLATLLDMCHVTDMTAPQMVRALWRRGKRASTFAPWPADTSLLSVDLIRAVEPKPLRNWADQVPARHPGKAEHLRLLLATQNHLHGAGPSPAFAQFSPLLSQPLMEFCLAVPTWLWCTGGINRALARAAFAQTLPASIVARISKAGPDSLMHSVFYRNRQLIRDMLMGGLLMDHGVLDRRAIEQALNSSADVTDATLYRLLDLTEAEAWARSWIG